MVNKAVIIPLPVTSPLESSVTLPCERKALLNNNNNNNNNNFFALIKPIYDRTDDRQACWALWGKLLTRNVPHQIYRNIYWC